MVCELDLKKAVTKKKKVYLNSLTKYGINGDEDKWMNLRDISDVKSTWYTEDFDVEVERKGNVEDDSDFLLAQWSKLFWHSLWYQTLEME